MIERGYFDAGINYETFKYFITSTDYVLAPIYFSFIIAIFVLLKTVFLKTADSRYFMTGLIAKLLGAVVLGLVYQYYYGGGDTTLYYLGGRTIMVALRTDVELVKAIYRSAANEPDPMISNLTWYIPYFKDVNGFFTVKIMGFFVTAGFGYYLPAALLNAAFWYPGNWLLYVTVKKIFPGHDRLMALCTLFIPSVVFWGSGILKDSITLSALGYLTYGTYNGLILRRRMLVSILVMAFGAYFLIKVKPYIILSFIPGALIWILITARDKMESQFLKRFITPLMVVGGIVGSVLILTKVSGSFEKYSVQNAIETAETFQVWHTYLSNNENASGYSLGVTGTSTTAILAAFLPAVGTTLFRPFLWEVRNPVMLLSSLESTIFLVVTLQILFRIGIRTFFREIFKNPFLFFCFFFFMLFGFAVGFTAYNFGALARYKIPCLPFYTVFLAILHFRSLEIRTERDQRRVERNTIKRLMPGI